MRGPLLGLKAMRQHPQAAKLVRFGCLLIRNLVSRNKNLQQPILDDGAEPVRPVRRGARTPSARTSRTAASGTSGAGWASARNYRDTSKAMHGMFTDHDRTTTGAGAYGNFSTSTKMSRAGRWTWTRPPKSLGWRDPARRRWGAGFVGRGGALERWARCLNV